MESRPTAGTVKRRPRPLELALLLAFATFSLYELAFGVFISAPLGAYYGWNVGSDGETIIYVTPDSPVERAGVRVGDRVDWRTLPLVGRANLLIPASTTPGTVLHAHVERDGRDRPITLVGEPFAATLQNAGRLQFIALIVVQYVAMALVWLRPSRLTWSFLFFAGAPFFDITVNTSTLHFALNTCGQALATGGTISAALLFVSIFPNNVLRPPLRWLSRLAAPAGIAVGGALLALALMMIYSSVPPPRWLLGTSQYILGPATSIAILVAIAISALTSRGSDRQRILPVLLAIAFEVLATEALTIYNERFTGGIGMIVFQVIEDLAILLVAAAVVNGVLRDRVMDISFTVSRTIVYTLLTTILLALFGLIDFVSSKFLERFTITLYLEAAATLAFGIALNSLHARIEHAVDRFVFRKRYVAEKRLRRTARSVAHSESETFIDEALVLEAMDALELSSAALFRRAEDGAYARVASEGWTDGHAARLAHDDRLVVHLMAELEPIDIDELRWPNVALPSGLAHPLLAMPVTIRHELLGFVLYGGHRGGEAIDPDERRTLSELAREAGAAYEHTRIMRLTRDAERWALERARLEHEQRLLRSIVDSLGLQR